MVPVWNPAYHPPHFVMDTMWEMSRMAFWDSLLSREWRSRHNDDDYDGSYCHCFSLVIIYKGAKKQEHKLKKVSWRISISIPLHCGRESRLVEVGHQPAPMPSLQWGPTIYSLRVVLLCTGPSNTLHGLDFILWNVRFCCFVHKWANKNVVYFATIFGPLLYKASSSLKMRKEETCEIDSFIQPPGNMLVPDRHSKVSQLTYAPNITHPCPVTATTTSTTITTHSAIDFTVKDVEVLLLRPEKAKEEEFLVGLDDDTSEQDESSSRIDYRMSHLNAMMQILQLPTKMKQRWRCEVRDSAYGNWIKMR